MNSSFVPPSFARRHLAPVRIAVVLLVATAGSAASAATSATAATAASAPATPATSATATSQQGFVVGAQHVEEALARGAVLWDVRDAAAYKAGHLPGAVSVGDVASVLRDPNREDWIAPSQVAKILGDAGIDLLNKEVVVYSWAGDPNAYYALNGIRHFGGKDGKVYHGGFDDWKSTGRPVSQEATVLPKVALTLTPGSSVLIGNDEMLSRVKEGHAQIVDARTPREFSGEDIRAIRGGRIPNAINLPYEQNWVDPLAALKLARREVQSREGMSLKPSEDLKSLYADLDPDKEVVVYCQSGVRASVTATILKDLGFKDVKVYEPSWLGYAGRLDAPVEQEVFLNVGALNNRIGAMQTQMSEMAAELARLKAAR